ncbi:MAG: hypothetical protein CM15mP117_00020 [Alphaproteobacteria bacterium]|nr:MAG: hypothetical protein CM15mP117_00020 [Alphaproteobacteria bacterium]
MGAFSTLPRLGAVYITVYKDGFAWGIVAQGYSLRLRLFLVFLCSLYYVAVAEGRIVFF